jgi:hypothetical protein
MALKHIPQVFGYVQGLDSFTVAALGNMTDICTVHSNMLILV